MLEISHMCSLYLEAACVGESETGVGAKLGLV